MNPSRLTESTSCFVSVQEKHYVFGFDQNSMNFEAVEEWLIFKIPCDIRPFGKKTRKKTSCLDSGICLA